MAANVLKFHEIAEKVGAKVYWKRGEKGMVVSRGKGDKQKKQKFDIALPKSLEDAFLIEGEGDLERGKREVFGRYLRAFAVDAQAILRGSLGDDGDKKQKTRVSYLEEIESLS